MEFDIARVGTVLKVSLRGRLDTARVEAGEAGFEAAIVGAACATIIDLAQVSFVSSLGARMLIGVAHALRQSGRELALYGAQPLVAESLSRVIGQVIPLVADEAAALVQVHGSATR